MKLLDLENGNKKEGVMKKLFLIVLLLPAIAWAGAPQIQSGSSAAAGVEDDAYGAGWNSDTSNAPSQNAVYDKIEALDTAKQADNDDMGAWETIYTHGTTTVDLTGYTVNLPTLTVIAIPSAASPTVDASGEFALDSDDYQTLVYANSDTRVVGGYRHCETFPILEPDEAQGANADIALKQWHSTEFPHGAKILSVTVSMSEAVTDTHAFYEWDNRNGDTKDMLTSVALSTAVSATTSPLTNDTVASNSWFVWRMDAATDDVAQGECVLCYEILPGN
jgi:hypothetical protein